ncbi:hypothetical protein ['Camptotheca acuminata' phytoplasma]|uniref:hypothetical protein n=1 Tax='Camptotheca acuminata' phytoplasma TaxID=3239192 RepID=UPI003519ED68
MSIDKYAKFNYSLKIDYTIKTNNKYSFVSFSKKDKHLNIFKIIEYLQEFKENEIPWGHLMDKKHFHSISSKIIKNKSKELFKQSKNNTIYQMAVPNLVEIGSKLLVLGIIKKNIFYLVAIDPEHQIYPQK